MGKSEPNQAVSFRLGGNRGGTHLTDPLQEFMILSTPAGIQSTIITLARSMGASWV